ncbi:chemotaxis protein methyltransferase CheR [Microvirga flocculans]|uniref:protein-glutamate O-methyltransferase n=1 Tax=Microvirga flocculans TaxID=217168 RepID=A0A7W6ICU8_9HYPH|nr:protein-glutamate O-methyltransferase CheR [Microvirga flocculans]MBB4038534.1 chemotaxis protein methyltransferase CheR [Microvirga flocculans]
MAVRLRAARPLPLPLLDAGFVQLKDRIIARTGHFYYQDKDDLLWERVRKRLRATGLSDSSEYLNLLDDSISGPLEWGRLEAEITIGETFFFRYAEQFAALRETILPEILARKNDTRRLRIWSAGCSTGAEPYSLAILVKEILGEEIGTWRISIVGTDINDSFLHAAREARFGKWALRSMPEAERNRYFAEAGKEQWQVRPEFRALVRFERHNLLSLLDGSSPLELTDFDLILCRNVLIYFHPETVTRIVAALHDRLAEDGWMLLGHAEPNPSFSAMMRTLNLPGTVAYRQGSKQGSETVRVPAPYPASPALPDWQPILPEPKRREPDRKLAKPRIAARSLEPLPSEAPEEPRTVLDEIRTRADAGDFAAADALCRGALAHLSLNAPLHFYHGLVLQGLGRPGEAEKSFLKSIYLDKNFAMAHYHLGLLLLSEGRSGPGIRCLTNAARVAAAFSDERILDESDGLIAKDLRHLVRLHLDAVAKPKRTKPGSTS